jgi:hypothetical protein
MYDVFQFVCLSPAHYGQLGSLTAVFSLDFKDAISKYKMAAQIVNRVTAKLVELCLPGASLTDLCNFGDQFLEEQVRSPEPEMIVALVGR